MVKILGKCKNKWMKNAELSYKASHEQTTSLKGILENGICISNILQYDSNAIFITARSKIIHDVTITCGCAESPLDMSITKMLMDWRANLILPPPTKTEGRIGTGGTAISVTISFSGLSPRFSNSQSCRILKCDRKNIVKLIKKHLCPINCSVK